VAPDEPHGVLNMTSAKPGLSLAGHATRPAVRAVSNVVSDAGTAKGDGAGAPVMLSGRTSVGLGVQLREDGATRFLARPLAID
jgi:hypothetical protein